MTRQTAWKHIDVPLRALTYGNTDIAGQGKGSTTWAAHSHTPSGLEVWEDFEESVVAEGNKSVNQNVLDIDFSSVLASIRLKAVEQEEDVTDNLERLLEVFADDEWNLSGGVKFKKSSQHVTANPDIIAEDNEPSVRGEGVREEYASPGLGERAALRRIVESQARKLYRFPFETKPFWKFRFLEGANSHQTIISEWEVPKNFDAVRMRDEDKLPKSWSDMKKKIFHAVRQLYGQMATDHRRYGILHIYESWFFCSRTEHEIFRISRPFGRNQTSPSIFQCIKTMTGFDNHYLERTVVHPCSAAKAPSKKNRKLDGVRKDMYPPNSGGSGSSGHNGGTGETNSSVEAGNIALSIFPWDCTEFDYTDNIQLLTLKQDPTVLVKLQRDPRQRHVADEMAHEAKMYLSLSCIQTVRQFIPRFMGYSTHLGVALSCIEKELDDFDDIGLENLSEEAKLCAVRGVEALSSAGVLHNDIDLRNIVLSRDDPKNRAKIIDFGRASFSNNNQLLADQVQHAKTLLGVE